MDSDHLWQLVIFFSLVSMSAIFSAAESAFRTISPTRVLQAYEEGQTRFKAAAELIAKPEKLRGVLIIGDSTFNIGAVILAAFAYKAEWIHLNLVLYIVLLTLVVLMVGEIAPRSLGSVYPEMCISRLSGLIRLCVVLFYPVIKILLWASDVFLALIGGNPDKNKPFITEEELMSYVNASHEDGVLEVGEKEMIYNVVEFGDVEVSQIMVPRIDMVTAPIDATYDELYALFKTEAFTRIPIYEENKDHIVGILNIKDWMFYDGDPKAYRIEAHMRQPFFTYESKKNSELLNQMRQNKHQMAIVLDEYGGTSGLATLEDLIEEIVGEIDDEFDEEDTAIRLIADNCYAIEGSTHIEDVNDRLGLSLSSEDFDSIGGFVIGLMGKLPEPDETATFENLHFKVCSVARNRIERIELCIHSSADFEQDGDTTQVDTL